MKLLIIAAFVLPFTLAQVCRDLDTNNCRYFVQVGFCRDPYRKPFMRRNCARSCKFCSTIVTRSPPSGCFDRAGTACANYLAQGYCRHPFHKKAMEYHCKKTCNFCNVQPPTFQPQTNGPRTNGPVVTGKPTPGSCGVPKIPHGRVISGTTARPGSWPWQVLMLTNGRPGCGGSLVNSQWIVTAAHCVRGKEHNPGMFTLVMGEHDFRRREGNEQSYRAAKVISHPRFSQYSFDHDIAMIKLQRPVTMNTRVSPVCLPRHGADVPVGTQCYISGWGKITSGGQMHNILQQAKMPIADSYKCNQHNQRGSNGRGAHRITTTVVCAGDAGATRRSGCHGDSGGPLVCRTGSSGAFELHGAVSWGAPNCNSRNSYTMFARVSQLRNWIDSTMRRY